MKDIIVSLLVLVNLLVLLAVVNGFTLKFKKAIENFIYKISTQRYKEKREKIDKVATKEYEKIKYLEEKEQQSKKKEEE